MVFAAPNSHVRSATRAGFRPAQLLRRALALISLFVLWAGSAALLAQEVTQPTEAPSAAGVSTSINDPLPVSESAAATPDLGTGNFSRTPFHVSVAVREGYDDNVYTTHDNTVDSFFTNGSVVLDYKFGSQRTQLDLQVFGGLTYYYNRPFGQEYDINSGLSLTVSHQATPRLGLSGALYLAYQSEPDFNTGIGLNRRSGNYFYSNDRFATSYQWAPRFSTVSSYTLGVINYEDSSISTYEDRVEHTFANEFRYLALPTTTLVGEYRYQLIVYDTALRDSMTHFVLAGVDHSFNPRFNISLRGGVEFREFEDFGERTSPYGESTLNYSLGERTTVSWISRFGLDEPDVPGSASRTTFRSGLRANYAFTPRISANLSLFYQHDENESIGSPAFLVPAFNEDSIDIALGLRYEINRTFSALAGYSHTEVFSDILLREYARNRYYLGLNATF